MSGQNLGSLASLNFGVGDFWKAVPSGGVSLLAGAAQKTLGTWERLWLAGREGEAAGDTTLTKPMEQSAWVLAAIDLVLQQITPLKLEWFASREDDEALPIDAERAQWWTFPAQTQAGPMPFADFVEVVGSWLKLQGLVHLVLTDEWLTSPRGLSRPPFYIARPDGMRPLRDYGSGGDLVGWQWSHGGQQEQLIPEQVITLRKASPYDEIGGLAAYCAARTAAESDAAAGRFAKNVAASNGSTGEYITTDGPAPTPQQQEQIIAALREKRRRVQRGDFAPTFLAGGLKVEDPKMKSVDAAFVSQRIENRHEIYAALGVPMSFADIKSAYSLGADSDMRQLVWGASMPLSVKIAAAIALVEQRRTVGASTLYAAFGWAQHPTVAAVREGKVDVAEKLARLGVPMREINQFLDLGLPRFLGDDVGFVPFNVQPVQDALNGSPETVTNPRKPKAESEAPVVVQDGYLRLADMLQKVCGKRALPPSISTATTINHEAAPGGATGNEKSTTGAAAPSNSAAPVARAGGANVTVTSPLTMPAGVMVLSFQSSSVSAPAGDSAAIIDELESQLSSEGGAVSLGGSVPPPPIQMGARASQSDKSRTRLWQSHQAKRAPWEKKVQGALKKVFGQYRAKALERLNQWGESVGYRANTADESLPLKAITGAETKAGFNFIITLPEMQRDVQAAVTPVLKATLEKAGEECLTEVAAPDGSKFAPDAAKVNQLFKLRENRIAGATEEVYNRITESLEEGYQKGETMAELRGRVKTEFAEASDVRANTIAATETAAIYNAARMAAMKQAGISHKEWLTARDSRVRADHEEIDGTILPIDEPFILAGGVSMMTPCDPNGPADQVINCRCLCVAAIKGGEES